MPVVDFPDSKTNHTGNSLRHPVDIGGLKIPGNIFAAPMAGYSDIVARAIALRNGADLAYTEMISAQALVHKNSRTLQMLKAADGEQIRAVQLFGHNEELMRCAAKIAAEQGADLLDLNAGCPMPKVTKAGSGSALLRNPLQIGRLVSAMRESGLPVSVKIRSGWDEDEVNWHDAARAAIDAGAAALTFHPRTRKQLYGGKSDWRLITELVEFCPIPVIGSGDLDSPESALRMLQETGCAALMFARGAIGKPLIYSNTRRLLSGNTLPPEPGEDEKKQLAIAHLREAIQLFGEEIGQKKIKKHLAGYISGFTGASELRFELMRAKSSKVLLEILESGGGRTESSI